MKQDITQPIDIFAIEREARRLRAVAIANAMRGLGDWLFRRNAPAGGTAAARTA